MTNPSYLVRRILTCSLLLILLFVTSLSYAATSINVTAKRVGNSQGATGYYPAWIDDDRIVWIDTRGDTTDIYMYDLITEEETLVVSDVSSTYNIVLTGNNISWHYSQDIWTYNIETGQKRILVENATSISYLFARDNKLVWDDRRSGNYDIYMYDFDTDQEVQITTDLADQTEASVSGDKIVWVDKRNSLSYHHASIYMYDLSTQTEAHVYTGILGRAQISGNNITWMDGEYNYVIYAYDLDTQVLSTLTSTEYYKCANRIYDNILVWEDSTFGDGDIVYKNIETNEEFILNQAPGYQVNPVIWKNKIVWKDDNDHNLYWAEVPITLIPAAPVFDVIENLTVQEDVSFSFQIKAYDPNTDNITYSVANLPAGATFDAETQMFGWDPPVGSIGIYSVTFYASDGIHISSIVLLIEVVNNNAPVFTSLIDAQEFPENHELKINLTATDSDGNFLSFSSPNLPQGATLDALTGEFLWHPSYVQSGDYVVTFEVSDDGLVDLMDVLITVLDHDNGPIFTAIEDKTVQEMYTIYLYFSATDPNGDAISYSAENLPEGAVLNTYSKRMEWRPTYEQEGEYIVRFLASDGTHTGYADCVITVEHRNAPPVLQEVADVYIKEGQEYRLLLQATDIDGDDFVFYNSYNRPSNATFDEVTGEFVWTPSLDQVGTRTMSFGVRDWNDQDSIFVNFEVDYNRPYFRIAGRQTCEEGKVLMEMGLLSLVSK